MKVTDTPPLDLDSWKAEARELIAKLECIRIEFGHSDEAIGANSTESKRILALISELRMERKFRAKSLERLASAEEALKFYAENEWHGSVEIPGGKLIHATLPTGDTARAHFEKFKRKV